MRHECNYNPPLRLFVHPSTWAIISEQLLAPQDLSAMKGPTNDRAVEEYLRGIGRYAEAHGKPGELFCANPIQEYRNLRWPSQPGLSYVTAFDIYMAEWRKVTASLPDVDTPSDAELAPIMKAAIQPNWLREIIENKITAGKGPQLVSHTTPWRKRANEHLQIMMAVIRENAHMAQLLRASPALAQWQSGATPPQAASSKSNSNHSWSTQPIRNSWRQPASLGELHLRQPALASGNPGGGIGPQASGGGAGGLQTPSSGGGSGVNASGGGNRGGTSGGGGPPPTTDPIAPTCPHPGCTRKLKKMRGGNYFNTCYDHSPQGLAAAKAATSTAPVRTCILEGCDKPRAKSTNGKNYLACCREHYMQYRTSQQTSKPGNSDDTGTGEGNPPTEDTRTCYLCNGSHLVSMCPKLTVERRQELAEKLQMTGDAVWWTDRNNQKKAQEYATAHQWANVKAEPATQPGNAQKGTRQDVHHHGWAHIMDTTRHVYFDLGGEFNLADEGLYECVQNAVSHGDQTVKILQPAIGHARAPGRGTHRHGRWDSWG